MDPSAMEETNCLMACDANQENCGAGQISPNKTIRWPPHLRNGKRNLPGPGLSPDDRALNDP
jgi:hypothetical protein